MVTSPVPAGTVLYLDFSALGFEKPEFEGGHPVVVLSPEHKQRQGTAIVIPLTSEVGNHKNPCAVEISNASFARTSPTGRSFAICDKPISVALTRLEHYSVGRRAGANRQPSYMVRGEELECIKINMMRSVWRDDQVARLLSPEYRGLLQRLRDRQAKSKQLGRKIFGRVFGNPTQPPAA